MHIMKNCIVSVPKIDAPPFPNPPFHMGLTQQLSCSRTCWTAGCRSGRGRPAYRARLVLSEEWRDGGSVSRAAAGPRDLDSSQLVCVCQALALH